MQKVSLALWERCIKPASLTAKAASAAVAFLIKPARICRSLRFTRHVYKAVFTTSSLPLSKRPRQPLLLGSVWNCSKMASELEVDPFSSHDQLFSQASIRFRFFQHVHEIARRAHLNWLSLRPSDDQPFDKLQHSASFNNPTAWSWPVGTDGLKAGTVLQIPGPSTSFSASLWKDGLERVPFKTCSRKALRLIQTCQYEALILRPNMRYRYEACLDKI